MYDTITETYTAYEQACSQCIDDLYRTAYLVLVDADAAEKFVTEICVAGVHKYEQLEDEAEIRFRLTSDLYHRLKRRLWFCTPNTDALPEQLQVLTKQERLTLAMRFSSGLSAAESGRILRLEQNEYRKTIGKVKMQKLTPKHIDVMFMELRQKKVTGSKARNKKEEDIPYISSTMQRHIYTLLHGAMEKAVEWKVIPSNPVVCDPPPRSTTETATWDIDTLRMALDMMEDEILHLAVHLSFVCSLRIGEAMALSWDDVNLEKKEIYIRKTLQRVDKKALEELPGDSLYFMFPPKQLEKKSVLVLKKPKTKTSTRTLYITDELRNELQTRKEKIEQQRKYYGANYADYNLVFALEDGYPIEPKLCEKWFKKWQNGPGLAFPDIVFHSIRHSSTTYKLVLSQGDIKSVQGDTGHSSAKLVTDTYAHIQVDSRKALADSLEKDFYKKKDTEKSAEEKNPVDVAGLMNLIKENPELKNFLLASVLADESMKVQQMQN